MGQDLKCIYQDFESEVNRLGLEAVSARETDDFAPAFIRLYKYFRDNYIYYLLGKANKLDRFISDGSIPDDILDVYSDTVKEIVDFLLGKVKAYYPFKAAKGDKPFYLFLSRDLMFIKRDAKSKTQTITLSISKNDKNLIIRIKNLFDELEIPFGSERGVDIVSKRLGISAKKVRELIKIGHYSIVGSLERKFNPDDSRSWEDTYVEDADDFSDCEEEPGIFAFQEDVERVDVDTEWEQTLERLNRIYRENFFEKHKLVFPKGFTTEYIDYTVERYKKPPKSYEQTVLENWENLEIDYRRDRYADGRFLCIDRFIFDYFERVRRQIRSKEIADMLGLSASNYSKIYSSAWEIVKKNVNA